MELIYAWWNYFMIPFIAGLVGWGTNVVALEMTLKPLEFWGINLYRYKDEPWGLFGWQGIIPSKAEKMATICFELMTKRLFSIREVFGRLDPTRFSEVMADPVLLMMDVIINEVAQTYMPNLWESLPKEVRDDIVVTADSECGAFLADFMKDVQDHVDDVIDVKHMSVTACVANKHLIVKIFQECGDKEFHFIRISGLYFGFLFGIFQMLLYMVYPAKWTLPVAGFIVGWFTNYLALKIIFQPLEPKKVLCWTIQGIFLKRQKEVSAIFARVVITEIMHVKAIWEAILTGPLSSNFFAMLRAHTLVFTDRLIAEIQPLAVAGLGADTFAQMKEDIAQKVIDSLPSIIDNSYGYTQEALDMENTIRTKMQELEAPEFEGVLHPAFEEDEIQLIALGGILGAIVGYLQTFTM
ncbi:hypothetical protein MPSEU_000097000 [Mayamaea pseudoterrestris]|nr:hypothetical protein MPSEU_000097000 [Mayamaea pseudoterrestris]